MSPDFSLQHDGDVFSDLDVSSLEEGDAFFLLDELDGTDTNIFLRFDWISEGSWFSLPSESVVVLSVLGGTETNIFLKLLLISDCSLVFGIFDTISSLNKILIIKILINRT